MRLLPLIVLLLAPACAGAQSAAPATVESAYQAALLRNPTPLSLRRDQAEYLRDRAENPDAEGRLASDEDRLERLLAAAEVDLRATTAAASLEDAIGDCVDLGALRNCRTTEGGWLTPREGPRLFWQIQAGFTPEDGGTSGIVFFTETSGRLEPVAWAWQGSRYSAPVVFGGADNVYIAIPGRSMGAGRSDADLIFRWTPGTERPLTQIDSWSWRDQVSQKLPGLNAFGRVRIDYEEMIALTEMFRDGDAGCCGTGGHALIDFAIEGDALVVSDARLRDR
ncbi:hypothetical protein [Brevundimonas sp.]|jgi:hypothetical protein|uniref:hypothetical protein n=1 Tax=Brevundimonas sp. TaxID=1871086 RepID=UPI003783291B